MARPSYASLEQGDPFGTREARRLGRKHMRRIDQALMKDEPGTAPVLLNQLLAIWEHMRASERHAADLMRNPPKPNRGPTKPATLTK